jgi:hypothetical protein
MSLSSRYLPEPILREVDHVAVAADSSQAWEAIRQFDAYQVPFVRALFGLRQLPQAIGAKLRGKASELSTHARIDDLVAGTGFQLFEEVEGLGVAVGAVGKFWLPSIPFREVAPDAFAAFAEPGFGKVCWSIEATPRKGGGSWITFEVRVDATDERARARFRRYWHLIGPFSHAIRRAALRRLVAQLGPPRGERVLPGDELLGDVRFERTHQTILEATPDRVWPWLVQMGCQRGGWYAIDFLDNGGQPSADHIEPEWQTLAPGDLVPATPDGRAAFGVLEVDRQHALVLGSPSLRHGGPPAPNKEPPYQLTWAFVLEPVGEDATCLTVRLRARYQPTAGFFLQHAWNVPAHEVMTRQQLRHLKTRIERPARA